MESLLTSLEVLEESLKKLDTFLIELGRQDKACQRLMTIPGVGTVTAMTYISTIDDAGRFEKSETVGAYLGMTPRQYASGAVNRHGNISKMGPKECRCMLYEAAQTLMTRVKNGGRLQKWALKLAKKKGKKKAATALGRKLAVIMHRMLVSQTDFHL